ncbi:hypothetical protein Tco_1046757, partial [Tanacetum coccineum]
GLGIHITKASGMYLKAYSDADWAKCVVTRKSVTGYYSLFCDSKPTIKIAANPVFHERTKHLEIDLHFVKENILKGVIKTVKVESANQIADNLAMLVEFVNSAFKHVKELLNGINNSQLVQRVPFVSKSISQFYRKVIMESLSEEEIADMKQMSEMIDAYIGHIT